MATRTTTLTKGTGLNAGAQATLYFDAFTMVSGDTFKRFKVTKSSSMSLTLTGTVQMSWDNWYTNRAYIHWDQNGDQPWFRVKNNNSSRVESSFTITFETEYNDTYTITLSAQTGGSVTASKTSAQPGTTITLYPVADTGYEHTGYTTSPSTTITNNKFTMPSSNVSITAKFGLRAYTITKKASPADGGTVSAKISGSEVTTGKMGQTVAVSQTANTGYLFDSWTSSPANLISNGSFTMPAKNVTITAKYLKRSTATVNRTNLTGGGTVTLTISPDKSTYTHTYRLNFGTGMRTSWVTVPAGTTSVTISVPDSWSESIQNDTSKTGGTLTVRTYKSSTIESGNLIGSYEIEGFTYNVPSSAVPTISNISKSIQRTIGGTTYANVGDYYVQAHCGVDVSAAAAGQLGATITGMSISILGYSGSSYNATAATGSISLTSGLLTMPGSTTIAISATDTRGRTTTVLETITVTAYTAPEGSLSVERVDALGDPDDLGQYAAYAITKQYTQVGTNALSAVTLTSQGTTATASNDTGDLLPGTGNRQTFSDQLEYQITLTLTDAFETTTVTVKLPSAKFIIHTDAGGDRIAFMKAATKTPPAGKSSTVEFSADSQIYIGDDPLEKYFGKMTVHSDTASLISRTWQIGSLLITIIKKLVNVSIDNASGNIYYASVSGETFPIAYSETPLVIPATIKDGTNAWVWSKSAQSTTSTGDVYIGRGGSATSKDIWIQWIAVGYKA